MTDVMFNPFEPGFVENPYDQYRRLRDAGPALPSPLGGWQLLDHESCFRLLREPHTSVEERNIAEPFFDEERQRQLVEEAGGEVRDRRSILNIDPPDHTRLRKLVSRVFTPRAIERLRPEVERMVDEFLADVTPGEEFDVIGGLAFPLPFEVIRFMLGMPEADRDQLRGWSHTLVATLDPIVSDEAARDAIAAGKLMNDYLAEVIQWKRTHPGDDLLTGLISEHDDGDRLTDEELQDQVTLLFIAGHETTVNLIGNAVHLFARFPDQRRVVLDDPSVIGNAIEECLRFEPPVQMTRRITLEPFEIPQTTIDPGTFVMAMTAAANRDPVRWGDDAESFDVRRDGAHHHLTFGSGIHHCLGAALARMEGQVAVGRFLDRFPDYDLAGDPTYNGRIVLRGLDHLPVTA